jgi:DNA-binding CsgD family transcriptional regulator
VDGPGAIVAILAVQAVSAVLFITNIALSILSISPFAWAVHELIEVGAAVGLILGTILGAGALRRSHLRTQNAESRLRAASGAFMDLLKEHFAAWSLTPAERDVALFAIKGLSTPEIAQMRQTSEGTVKAQTAAIYRKAGVTGRPQLLSLFIEDLMDGPIVSSPKCEALPPQTKAHAPGTKAGHHGPAEGASQHGMDYADRRSSWQGKGPSEH